MKYSSLVKLEFFQSDQQTSRYSQLIVLYKYYIIAVITENIYKVHY